MIDDNEVLNLVNQLRSDVNRADAEAVHALKRLLGSSEMRDLLLRRPVQDAIETAVRQEGRVSLKRLSKEFDCDEKLVTQIWRDYWRKKPPVRTPSDQLVVSIPKEARAHQTVDNILAERGFRLDLKEKAIVDIQGRIAPVAFRVSRAPELIDLLTRGVTHAGFLGNDKIREADAKARRQKHAPLALDIRGQFGVNDFRFCFAVPKMQGERPITDLQHLRGRIVATSYPHTVRDFLASRKIAVRRIKQMSGGVEAAPRDYPEVDAIADIVQTGTSLKDAGLRVLGDPVYEGNTSFMTRAGACRSTLLDQFAERLQARAPMLKAA